MLGGYNVAPLVELLDNAELAGLAAEALKKTLLVFDAFHDVADKAKLVMQLLKLFYNLGLKQNGSLAVLTFQKKSKSLCSK